MGAPVHLKTCVLHNAVLDGKAELDPGIATGRFHAEIDAQIPNGHDDPLNFKVDNFANSLDALIAKLGTPDQIQAAHQ